MQHGLVRSMRAKTFPTKQFWVFAERGRERGEEVLTNDHELPQYQLPLSFLQNQLFRCLVFSSSCFERKILVLALSGYFQRRSKSHLAILKFVNKTYGHKMSNIQRYPNFLLPLQLSIFAKHLFSLFLINTLERVVMHLLYRYDRSSLSFHQKSLKLTGQQKT